MTDSSLSPVSVDGVDLDRRFGGLQRLWGDSGAQACRAAHVVVVGLGGVGSWAVEALARSGVGVLTLIDLDHVSESNVNRQIQATSLTLGQSKVNALTERVATIHPGCRVFGLEEFVEPGNVNQLLGSAAAACGPIHAVLDACDQVAAKQSLVQWCKAQQKPFVTVGAAGGKKHAYRVTVADLAQVTHDPLLARLRQRLRKDGRFPSGGANMKVNCVFSPEPILRPQGGVCDAGAAVNQSDGSLNCHGYGSLVTVTATMGMTAAGVLLNRLASAD